MKTLDRDKFYLLDAVDPMRVSRRCYATHIEADIACLRRSRDTGRTFSVCTGLELADLDGTRFRVQSVRANP